MISKKLWAALGTAAILASAAIPALAADTAGVSATVTPQLISVSVSPGSVAYGTVPLSQTDVAPSPDSVITATNNGNVTEKFEIKGANSTTWTLSDVAVAANTFMHKFGLWNGVTLGALTALHNTTYKTLQASVGAGGTQDFKLRISTPTSTTTYATESTSVTVLATAI